MLSETNHNMISAKILKFLRLCRLIRPRVLHFYFYLMYLQANCSTSKLRNMKKTLLTLAALFGSTPTLLAQSGNLPATFKTGPKAGRLTPTLASFPMPGIVTFPCFAYDY